MNLLNKKELLILGMRHKVTYFENHDNGDNAMGRSDVKKATIRICKEMGTDTKEQTILHEAIHIISDHLALSLTENQVCALSAGLYSFFKENKL